MCRGGEPWQEQTMPHVKGVCADRLPHLRGDFTTCSHACTQPYGHRPETPHRCADGHEWFLDEASRDLRQAQYAHENSKPLRKNSRPFEKGQHS
jgi:hypothetical protein